MDIRERLGHLWLVVTVLIFITCREENRAEDGTWDMGYGTAQAAVNFRNFTPKKAGEGFLVVSII